MLLKRLKSLTFALLTSLVLGGGTALAAGTVPLALSVQTDSSGNIAAGCILSFFVAGTVAQPQNAYPDFALSQTPFTQVTCDQSGRLPMFWLADGLIHLRLTDSSGAPIIDTTMQVLGPSSGGGGGGGTVDPTTIFATGDEKIRYGTGAIAGFVRENGLTIGNAVSGGTERANADTQALFVYLYNTDSTLVVSGGRTGNALNDFNANKTIAVPDMRGRINAFLADMGNSASSVLTATTCASPTVLGFACGGQTSALSSVGQLPQFTPSTSSATVTTPLQGDTSHPGSNVGAALIGNNGTGPTQVSDTVSITFNSIGSLTPNPFGVLPPVRLKTAYIKL